MNKDKEKNNSGEPENPEEPEENEQFDLDALEDEGDLDLDILDIDDDVLTIDDTEADIEEGSTESIAEETEDLLESGDTPLSSDHKDSANEKREETENQTTQADQNQAEESITEAAEKEISDDSTDQTSDLSSVAEKDADLVTDIKESDDQPTEPHQTKAEARNVDGPENAVKESGVKIEDTNVIPDDITGQEESDDLMPQEVAGGADLAFEDDGDALDLEEDDSSGGGGSGAGSTGGNGKTGGFKKVLAYIVALVLLGGGGYFAYDMFLAGPDSLPFKSQTETVQERSGGSASLLEERIKKKQEANQSNESARIQSFDQRSKMAEGGEKAEKEGKVPPMPTPFGRETKRSPEKRTEADRKNNETIRSARLPELSSDQSPEQSENVTPDMPKTSQLQRPQQSSPASDSVGVVDIERSEKEKSAAEQKSVRTSAEKSSQKSPQKSLQKLGKTVSESAPGIERLNKIEENLDKTNQRLADLAMKIDQVSAMRSESNNGLNNKRLNRLIDALTTLEKKVDELTRSNISSKSQDSSSKPRAATEQQSQNRGRSSGQATSPKKETRQIQALKNVPSAIPYKPQDLTDKSSEQSAVGAPQPINDAAEDNEDRVENQSDDETVKQEILPYARQSADDQPSSETVKNWTLKAAQPGKAWLSPQGSDEINQYEEGDVVPGIGVIQSVTVVNGAWEVRGTSGVVRQ